MVAYLKRRVSCLFDMAKYIGQRPRNDASIRISFCSTRNRKCLSGTSLPICKYRPVQSTRNALDDATRRLFVDLARGG